MRLFFLSPDGGANWVTVNSGLRTRAVNALALSEEGMVLYAATEGEGVFRLDAAGAISAADNPPTTSLTELEPSYPNPFNPVTTIVFNLGKPTRVSLRIYDAGGRLVRTLLEEPRGAGRHRLVWDGCDDSGRGVASGVYLYRLTGAGVDRTRKMVLVR